MSWPSREKRKEREQTGTKKGYDILKEQQSIVGEPKPLGTQEVRQDFFHP